MLWVPKQAATAASLADAGIVVRPDTVGAEDTFVGVDCPEAAALARPPSWYVQALWLTKPFAPKPYGCCMFCDTARDEAQRCTQRSTTQSVNGRNNTASNGATQTRGGGERGAERRAARAAWWHDHVVPRSEGWPLVLQWLGR